MITPNINIFKVYLALMSFLSSRLTKKYLDCSASDSKHYQTIMIQKIVRMFHTLEYLAENTTDEVSARCVLRGILDSVTTYCFIYQRKDNDEIMFRHYLYVFDGFKSYNDNVIGGVNIDNCDKFICNNLIQQIELKLKKHPYSSYNDKIVEDIIRKRNWKYDTLQNGEKLSFLEMYLRVGFDKNVAQYFHSYLAQYAHGLLLSNTSSNAKKMLEKVVFESIIIESKMYNAITQIFPTEAEEAIHLFFKSDAFQELLQSKEYSNEVLSDYIKKIKQGDRTFLF